MGGSHVTAKRNVILETYQSLCSEFKIPFSINSSIISPDSSTLFTTSGMQHFKPLFPDSNYFNTFCNIQKCLRLNDLNEIGDGTHFLDFEMIGLFSFRQWTVKNSIDFFMNFLTRLDIKPDYVTIHPDMFNSWREYYTEYGIEIRQTEECLWSDGNVGGYCTEFFKNEIEIGNIVNPLGTCIDVGFGLERLIQVSGSPVHLSKLDVLEKSFYTIINSGIVPHDKKEGFILKKIINLCILEGSKIDHIYLTVIKKNIIKNYQLYKRDKVKKHLINKPDEYWKNSYGIDVNLIDLYEKIILE